MKMPYRILSTVFLCCLSICLFGQEVPILNYSTDINGQVQLQVASSEGHYYILKVRHGSTGDFEWPVSMTLGEEGSTVLTEPNGSYPIDHYQVLEYPIANPADTDLDGIDDVTEFLNMPTEGPLNFTSPLDFVNGAVAVNSFTTFKELAVTYEWISWAQFLNGKKFMKFVIVDIETATPKIYFVNSKTHYLHGHFMDEVGIDQSGDNYLKGEILYHPSVVANNGTLGAFSFNYSLGLGKPFETVQKCHEMLASNMPFLKNNLSYFVTVAGQSDYEEDQTLFDNSRIPILLEEEVYAEVDYLALNVAEGFGLFRVIESDDMANSRDVVLYESLPNAMPRVAGIMTSVIQTPLSHVNLRAIQDDLPNAFIRDPLSVDSISSLVGKYVYYKVDQAEYFIREASQAEVNDWFEDIRPDKGQIPKLNLDHTSILPLDEISFGMADGFGAKCSNIATMRTFGFPEGTIPNGFGIPFYFYQEFMNYNGFFDEIKTMIANPDFESDLDVRLAMLKDLRSKIKDAGMPPWMMDELQTMQESFPEGTSIRCRSSTNNEDLPGFSGAGLYTSKTQHPEEGHITKSIKQVYASMWNFRAFDERDFHRVDHFMASMGVLCHPNFKNEIANGVGVSTDPIYQTDDTFYLNTQLGEDLVTNPTALSIAEEILLDRFSVTNDDYVVVRYSNLVEDDALIMGESYLDQMRDYLSVIHDEFAVLYNAVGHDEFAMDIEYKIDSEGQLVIKQARPWASYMVEEDSSHPTSTTDLIYFPNPVSDYLVLQCDCETEQITIYSLTGQKMIEEAVDFSYSTIQIHTRNLPRGVYILTGVDKDGEIQFSEKLIKK